MVQCEFFSAPSIQYALSLTCYSQRKAPFRFVTYNDVQMGHDVFNEEYTTVQTVVDSILPRESSLSSAKPLCVGKLALSSSFPMYR